MRPSPDLRDAITETVTRIGEAWSSAVPFPCRIEPATLCVQERDQFLRSLGTTTCVGRSPFADPLLGIAGWVLGEGATDRLARGLLDLPPPPPGVTSDLGGPLERGMELLHQLFVEHWNRCLPAALRIREEASTALTERVKGLGNRSVPTPAYPWMLTVELEISGRPCPWGIFLAPALVETPVESFSPASRVVSWSHENRPSVAFVDGDGSLVRWLMGEIRSGRLIARRSCGAEATAPTLVLKGTEGLPPDDVLVIETA